MDPLANPDALATQIQSAAHGGQWLLLVALGISLVVALARRLGLLSRVPDHYLPIVSAVFGGASAFAAAVVAGQSPVSAAIAGVLSGLGATGLHQAVTQVRDGGQTNVTVTAQGSSAEDASGALTALGMKRAIERGDLEVKP